MTKPVVLLNRRQEQNESQIAELAEEYDFVYAASRSSFTDEELAMADAAILMGHIKMHRAQYAKAPKLKIVATASAGVDHIDLAAAAEHSVVVTNTPHLVDSATSEIALNLMLNTLRRSNEGERIIREGKWTESNPNILMGNSLSGKTVGILGMGGIGSAVAKKARAFDCRVVYHNRNRLAPEQEGDAEYVSLESLFGQSDVISVHLPLSPGTRHFISDNQFALMRPNAILINTSRGAVVDEEALVRALRDKKIMGAGLDVFDNEPHVHPDLLLLPNVSVFPHLGTANHETRQKMQALALDNVRAVLAGKPPLTPVAAAAAAHSQ